MTWPKARLHARQISHNLPIIIVLFCLLLLWGQCAPVAPPPSAGVRTILPAEQANQIDILPDGRRILHSGPLHPKSLLDMSTGQDVSMPVGAIPLDNDLLYGWEQPIQGTDVTTDYYMVTLPSLAVVKLEPLGTVEDLQAHIRNASGIYANVTNSLKQTYLILLVERDPSGNVVGGYFINGVKDLDVLLAGVSYKTPPAPFRCSSGKVSSPDGQYYYIMGDTLQIYSQEGELLNTAPRSYPGFHCYGWAWDSSGVYFQESGRSWMSRDVGPLQLLLANSEHEK